MHPVDQLGNKPEVQAKRFEMVLCDNIVSGRVRLTDMIDVPAGVLLSLLNRVAVAEEALKDVIVRLNNVEYS